MILLKVQMDVSVGRWDLPWDDGTLGGDGFKMKMVLVIIS